MTDLHAVLLAAITARQERAQQATKGPWSASGKYVIVGAALDQPGLIANTVETIGTGGNGYNASHIAAESPDVVLRQCAEDLWMLSQHERDEADVARGLDPECSCGSQHHRTCPHVLSIARRYGIDTNGDQA